MNQNSDASSAAPAAAGSSADCGPSHPPVSRPAATMIDFDRKRSPEGVVAAM
ncbi:hypothetical protein [Inquilinus sp. CAU 1745]|uniref:hypothetical protein n=1 Tax=Inquilinus sp. CAU 1745 TaxID=3140369 RepID=UPI00325AB6E0